MASTDLCFSTTHPQNDSPLYSTLPPEIRTLIFQLVLTAFPDTDNPYDFNSYHSRPGYSAPKVTDTRLLLTCKQIYAEAKDLLWRPGSGNDEEAFWWGAIERRPAENRALDADPDGGEFECGFASDNSYYEEGDYDEDDDYEEDEDDYEEGDESLSEIGGYALPTVEQVESIPASSEESSASAVHGLISNVAEQGDEDEVQDDPVWDITDESPNHAHFTEDGDEGTLHYNSNGTAEPPAEYLKHHIHRIQLRTLDDGPLQTPRQHQFSPQIWSKIKKIHIFPQLYTFNSLQFQGFFHLAPAALRPHTVRVTIRYTDWWWWENDNPLDLTCAPQNANPWEYYFPESCNTFVLELETTEAKRKELEREVRRIVDGKESWKWRRIDGVYLELDEPEDGGGIVVEEWDWMGPTRFGDGQVFDHHPPGPEMKYIVKVLRFTAKPTEVAEEEKVKPFAEVVAMREYCRRLLG